MYIKLKKKKNIDLASGSKDNSIAIIDTNG
jgi:hypothetical protein